MRFLADENFNNDILRGLVRRVSKVDITHVQDTDLAGKPDTSVLEWAARKGYIILSHDVNTMRGYFYDRVNAGLPVPGLFLVPGKYSVGDVIDELELILLASDESEWVGQIRYIPLS
ncbi:MAG: DUF5615 family PIN-like protein [Anaerolineae bacterium]